MLDTVFGLAAEHTAVLLAFSVATFVGTLVMVPILVTRLPQDYFVEGHRPRPLSDHLVLHWTLMALKNLLGIALVLLGLLLLVLPGQGLLTLIAGLAITNYPGKYALERWLAMRPRVLPALNWLRARHGKPPLEDP